MHNNILTISNSLTDYISISYFLAPILLPILAFTKSKKLNLFCNKINYI